MATKVVCFSRLHFNDLGPHCLPERLLKHFSRREKLATFDAIGALRVNFGRCLNTQSISLMFKQLPSELANVNAYSNIIFYMIPLELKD